MTSRNFVALSFAAVLLSTSFAVAATSPTRHTRHASAHATKPTSRAATTSADRSADSLNAQQLSKAQSGQ